MRLHNCPAAAHSAGLERTAQGRKRQVTETLPSHGPNTTAQPGPRVFDHRVRDEPGAVRRFNSLRRGTTLQMVSGVASRSIAFTRLTRLATRLPRRAPRPTRGPFPTWRANALRARVLLACCGPAHAWKGEGSCSARRRCGIFGKTWCSLLVYNALGIPPAAGVLYPAFGLLLSPTVAAA